MMGNDININNNYNTYNNAHYNVYDDNNNDVATIIINIYIIVNTINSNGNNYDKYGNVNIPSNIINYGNNDLN